MAGAAGLAALAVFTLLPEAWLMGPLGLVSCLACGEMNTLDAIQNVVLFVPAGLLLFQVLNRVAASVAIAAVISLGIEALQFFLLPGRDPSVIDVLTNAAGAGIGAALGLSWRSLGESAKAPSLVLRLGAGLLPFGVIAASGFLVSPTAVPPHSLYGQWAPRRPNFQPWPGRVISLDVGHVPVPHGLVPDQDGLRRAWEGGGPAQAVVQAPLSRGRRPSLLARVVAVNDELFLLAATADALIVRVRLRASDLGLRPLLWRVPHAAPAGGSFTVDVGFDARGIEAGGSSSGGVTRFTLDPSLGWALLLPVELPLGTWRHAVSGIWIAVLWLPAAALWPRRARRPAALIAAGALSALVLCLGVLPAALGAAPVHWLSWLGGVAGMAAGWRIAAREVPRRLSP